MSCTCSPILLYLLLAGRGSRGQCGPAGTGKKQTNKQTHTHTKYIGVRKREQGTELEDREKVMQTDRQYHSHWMDALLGWLDAAFPSPALQHK